MNILIADDDITTTTLLSEALAIYGQCTVCRNGREAVERFQELLNAGQCYELLIIDVMMPEMNGIDALKEIRRIEELNRHWLNCDVAALLLSQIKAPEFLEHAYNEVRHSCYLTKPVDLPWLLQVVRSFKPQACSGVKHGDKHSVKPLLARKTPPR